MIAYFCTVFLILLLDETAFAVKVTPQYLDSLLLSQNYDKFAEVTGIDVALVKPGPGTSDTPMFNKGLREGDILPNPRKDDQERQNVNFEKYPDKKWIKVPYSISQSFLWNIRTVQAGIDRWNSLLGDCIRWVPQRGESDRVLIFPGSGCFSNLGKVGGVQTLSLQMPGCLSQGIILHEMEHTVGFTHEHTRFDRDDFVTVLFENIQPQWRSQYEKNNEFDYGIVCEYDYDSVMHYPLKAPDSDKPAFRLPDGIDGQRLGQRNGPTQTDLNKIRSQYCPETLKKEKGANETCSVQ